MGNQEYMQVVTTVLAVGSVIAPILFGFVLWKMSTVFVSRESFEDFKRTRTQEQLEVREKLGNIENDIRELLQRTASRGRHNE